MTKLPAEYAWLADEHSPRILVAMLAVYGTKEKLGTGDNPVILGWARQLGIAYNHDAIPWCGLAMGKAADDAGYVPKGGWAKFNPLWAANWVNWGNKVCGSNGSQAALGDAMVFTRTGGNHVTLYVAESSKYWHCMGGNQTGDMVNIELIAKTRTLLGVRRSPFKTGQPGNVRKVYLPLGEQHG